MSIKMELQTERLLLRHWHENDAKSLYKYARNPRIGGTAGWPPHTDVDNSRELIKTVLAGKETYAMVLKDTGEAVGSIALLTEKIEIHVKEVGDNEAEIGYWIGEPYWGQGLTSEAVREMLRHAFEDLQIVVMWCAYFEGNNASKRVMEKCGFNYQYTEENRFIPLTKDFRTTIFMKLRREDWKKQNGLAL